MNMVYDSTYLCLLQFFSSASYNFPSRGLLHSWLNIFLGILFFLKQLWIRLFSYFPVPCQIRDESRHPCLVPDLKGNACSFCPLSMVLAVGLSYVAFIMFRYISCIPTLLRAFVINGAGFYQKLFLHLLICSCGFILHFVYAWNHIYWFVNAVSILHSWNKSHLNMVYDILMHFCIWFASILLRILASMHIRDIGLHFLFL